LDDFLMKLGKMTFEKSLNKSIKKGIITVEWNAKKETPVDTGLLRRSYETSFTRLTWEIRNYREYALEVHQGTRYQKANPYFNRWIDNSRDKIKQFFENDLIELLQFLSDE